MKAEGTLSDSLDRDRGAVFDGNPPLDVPGMLAERIGDLYASEEFRRRKERSDRLLQRAAQYAQD